MLGSTHIGSPAKKNEESLLNVDGVGSSSASGSLLDLKRESLSSNDLSTIPSSQHSIPSSMSARSLRIMSPVKAAMLLIIIDCTVEAMSVLGMSTGGQK